MLNKKNIILLTLIDLMFLPYLKPLPIKITMIVVPLYFFINIKKILDYEKSIYFIFSIFLMIISILVGFLFNHHNIPIATYLTDNFIIFVTMIIAIMLYFIVFQKESIDENNHNKIVKVIEVFMILNFVLAVIYWINPQNYFNLRVIWSYSGGVDFEHLTTNRFTSIFGDPNNLSPIIILMFLYLFYFSDLSNFKKMIYLIMLVYSTIASLSNTGSVILLFTIGMVLIHSLVKKGLHKNFKPYLYIAITISLVTIFYKYNLFSFETILNNFLGRANNYGDDISGLRFKRWSDYISNKNIMLNTFIGFGGNIKDGKFMKPHNGNLLLIYHFGFIFYIYFITLFFKNNKVNFKHIISFLVFFIIFTMNTLVFDFRAMILSIFMLALIFRANNFEYGKESYQNDIKNS